VPVRLGTDWPAADRPAAVLSSSSPKTGSPAAERSTSAEPMPTIRYRMMGQAEQAQEVRSLSITRTAIPATLPYWPMAETAAAMRYQADRLTARAAAAAAA